MKIDPEPPRAGRQRCCIEVVDVLLLRDVVAELVAIVGGRAGRRLLGSHTAARHLRDEEVRNGVGYPRAGGGQSKPDRDRTAPED